MKIHIPCPRLQKPEKVNEVKSSLAEMGLDSTIYDVKRAAKEKERVMTAGVSSTAEHAFSTRKVIAPVVNSDDFEDVTARMKKALNGDKSVIMNSAVEDLVKIYGNRGNGMQGI